MKLSALFLLAATACICAAQTSPARTSSQNPNIGIVDDQALSRAAAAVGTAARLEDLQKMMDRISQADCPVVLTNAGITPYLMLLRTSGGSQANSLDLEFRNTSGKEIRSMALSAQLLVKKSIYDLDYLPPINLYLTAYGTKSIDATFAQLRHLSLPEDIHPSLVKDIKLEQVTFEDGTVWTSRPNGYCGFKPGQSLPVAR